MTLKLANGEDIVLPLRRSEALAKHGACASYHEGSLDVMVTGCEGNDRAITIGGRGSWEYEASTGVTRRIEDAEDGCTSMEPPEDDADFVMMRAIVDDLEAQGLDVAETMQNGPDEFNMEVRYYYDESLLEKYDGDHSEAKNAVRVMHEHAKVMMRHETIGRKVHLVFEVEPPFVDLSIHAGPSNALPSFMGWLKDRDMCQRDVAFHHIITNRRSDGVSGVAWLGTVCHDDCYNTGITEVFFNEVSSAQTLAHEFGHNLGALHTFSRQNQGRNCHGIMSYGSRPDTWSDCSRERWTADYDIFLRAAGQSRADQCFRPTSGATPTPRPTPEPTRAPTLAPIDSTASGCKCDGRTSSSGSGGPSCSGGWCYTAVGACSDGVASRSVSNAEWSRQACNGGGSPAPAPTRPPVPSPTPPPVPTPTPPPVPRPTSPPGSSGACKCSGRTNSRGQGGKDCRTRYSSGAWCYTEPGVCSDGRRSTLISNADMSYLACAGSPAPSPTRPPVPSPTPPPVPTPTQPPVSSGGYKQMPGGGWCMESNGNDESPRYTMPYPTTLAKTKAACDSDSNCIAYVWGERYRVGMIYSTRNCKADCSNLSWHNNPSLITTSDWDGKRTFWRDAKCNVKN